MNLGPIENIFNQMPVFVLVLFRVAGLLTLAPLLGSVAIPLRVKPYIVIVLSLAVFPLVPLQTTFVPNSLPGLIVAVAQEMLIGVIMGFLLSLSMVGIQLGAHLVAQQMGLGFAQLVDPMFEADSDVLSQFYLLLATVIYVLMNGHLVLIKALAQTFHSLPLLSAASVFSSSGSGPLANPLLDTIVNVLNTTFILGIRIAAPALIAIFLATLALGFISRTMPQLNILAAGFPIYILLGLILLIASLTAVFLLFHHTLQSLFDQLTTLFNP